ncbi:hypothetical protein X975_14421, partial [Stegodyphus mimosarum]
LLDFIEIISYFFHFSSIDDTSSLTSFLSHHCISTGFFLLICILQLKTNLKLI